MKKRVYQTGVCVLASAMILITGIFQGYYSSTNGGNKECGVLLPAGYDKNQKYPVL